jgi:hypothetical protein
MLAIPIIIMHTMKMLLWNDSIFIFRNEKSVWNLEYLQVCIIIDIFHILPYTQLQILRGAKFYNSGRERVSLITHSDLRIHIFYNRRSFCLKLQRLFADISHNFSDVHQKGPKNMGIGPWPHYREQPQNLRQDKYKNPRTS